MSCRVVTFTCADGRAEKFPLDFLVNKGAMLVDKVNGSDIKDVMGASNQLWIPGFPAKYYLRDVVRIEFNDEDKTLEIPRFEDDGHDYTNRPNIAAKAPYIGRLGQSMKFEGWADDFDRSIAAIEFSIDDGTSWTRFNTDGSTAGKLTTWCFTWTPQEAGIFTLRVRSVNEDDKTSPVPAVCNFQIF